MFENID